MMITKSAKYISEILVREEIVNSKERPVYQYGLELLIWTVINFVLVFIIGSFLGSPVQGILYFLVFATLRTKAGGYHAPSYITCGILYSITFIITIWLAMFFSYIKVNSVILTLTFLVNTYIFWVFAPVLHKRKAEKKERKQTKVKAVKWSLIWTIIALYFYYMNSYWAYVIVVSITAISVFIFVGKIKEREEETYERKKQNENPKEDFN